VHLPFTWSEAPLNTQTLPLDLTGLLNWTLQFSIWMIPNPAQ
jgi:hypothetical protein